MLPLWLVVPVAVICGFAAVWYHSPAGAMIGALIGVGGLSLITGRSATGASDQRLHDYPAGVQAHRLANSKKDEA
jgi:hypothetical protein